MYDPDPDPGSLHATLHHPKGGAEYFFNSPKVELLIQCWKETGKQEILRSDFGGKFSDDPPIDPIPANRQISAVRGFGEPGTSEIVQTFGRV
jgi:hypothetical protein